MAARRPPTALSPTSVLRAGEDKGPLGRRIPPVGWAARSAGKLAFWIPAMPGDSPQTVPMDPEHSSCGAKGRTTLGTADSGFWPDASRARFLFGGACPVEVLPLLVDSSGPARPKSGTRSSAAAGCAHRNTAGTPGQSSSRRYRPRPGNCRHAPGDRLCYAPKQCSPMFIG